MVRRPLFACHIAWSSTRTPFQTFGHDQADRITWSEENVTRRRCPLNNVLNCCLSLCGRTELAVCALFSKKLPVTIEGAEVVVSISVKSQLVTVAFGQCDEVETTTDCSSVLVMDKSTKMPVPALLWEATENVRVLQSNVLKSIKQVVSVAGSSVTNV